MTEQQLSSACGCNSYNECDNGCGYSTCMNSCNNACGCCGYGFNNGNASWIWWLIIFAIFFFFIFGFNGNNSWC